MVFEASEISLAEQHPDEGADDRANAIALTGSEATAPEHSEDTMRRLVTPSIVIALVAMLVGFIYRHFADDPADATLANYARSGLHAVGIALSGWAVHL